MLPLHTLQNLQSHELFTTLHYTTLHYTTLHYTTLHYTTLHYTTLHYTTLHYTTLHYTTLHYTTLHYTTLHYTTLHYTTLHYTTLFLYTERVYFTFGFALVILLFSGYVNKFTCWFRQPGQQCSRILLKTYSEQACRCSRLEHVLM